MVARPEEGEEVYTEPGEADPSLPDVPGDAQCGVDRQPLGDLEGAEPPDATSPGNGVRPPSHVLRVQAGDPEELERVHGELQAVLAPLIKTGKVVLNVHNEDTIISGHKAIRDRSEDAGSTEMSNYIDIEMYLATEEDHPFYQEMLRDPRKGVFRMIGDEIKHLNDKGVKHPRLVDVGAGPGIISMMIAEEFPELVVMPVEVDVKEYNEYLLPRTKGSFYIMDGRIKVEQFPPNVCPIMADIRNLEIPEPGAHIIVCTFAFHHFKPWEKCRAMRQMKKMLDAAVKHNPDIKPIIIIADEHIGGNRIPRNMQEAKDWVGNLHTHFISRMRRRGNQLNKAYKQLYRREGFQGEDEWISALLDVQTELERKQSIEEIEGQGHLITEERRLMKIAEAHLEVLKARALQRNEEKNQEVGESNLEDLAKFLIKAHKEGLLEGIISATEGLDEIISSLDEAEDIDNAIEDLIEDLGDDPSSVLARIPYPSPIQWEKIVRRWVIMRAIDQNLSLRDTDSTDKMKYAEECSDEEMIALEEALHARGIKLPEVGECKITAQEEHQCAIAAGLKRCAFHRIGPPRQETNLRAVDGAHNEEGVDTAAYYDPREISAPAGASLAEE